MMRKWEIVRPESGEESGIGGNAMPRRKTSQRAAPRCGGPAYRRCSQCLV